MRELKRKRNDLEADQKQLYVGREETVRIILLLLRSSAHNTQRHYNMLVVVCVAQTQEDREAKLARLEELKKRNSELKEELKQYIDFDPELIDDMGNQRACLSLTKWS